MYRTIPALYAALLLLLAAPLPAAATVGVSVEFSDDEIRIINAWYREHDSSSDRGSSKHKHKGLPPGSSEEPGARQTAAARDRQAATAGRSRACVAGTARWLRAHHR